LNHNQYKNKLIILLDVGKGGRWRRRKGVDKSHDYFVIEL